MQVRPLTMNAKDWKISVAGGRSSDRAIGAEVITRHFRHWRESILSKARAGFRHNDSPLSGPFLCNPSTPDPKPDSMQFLHRAVPVEIVQAVARFEWQLRLDPQEWIKSKYHPL